jgi:hypothetical protein
MMQLPLYIDAAFADRADVHGLPDFAETPSHRPKGGHGFALDWQDANRRAMAELARAVKEGRHIPGPEARATASSFRRSVAVAAWPGRSTIAKRASTNTGPTASKPTWTRSE